MTLNDDLVRLARGSAANLFATVERLLAEFVEQQAAREASRQRDIELHVDASNVFVAKYGTLADEFSSL